MKKTVIKSLALGLFVLLMVFNLTTSINNDKESEEIVVELSLSGLKAMAADPIETKSCSSGGTWAPYENYRECSGCVVINGWDAVEISTCVPRY